jgi:hypothetical protein
LRFLAVLVGERTLLIAAVCWASRGCAAAVVQRAGDRVLKSFRLEVFEEIAKASIGPEAISVRGCSDEHHSDVLFADLQAIGFLKQRADGVDPIS